MSCVHLSRGQGMLCTSKVHWSCFPPPSLVLPTPAGIALAVASLAVAAAQAARLFLYNTQGTGVAAKAAAVLSSNGSFTEKVASAVSAAATGSGPLWWLLPASGVALAVGAAWCCFKVYKGLKQWEQDNVFFRDYDLRYGPDHRPELLAH